MDYDTEVEDDACNFIIEHEDMIIQALVNGADWDYNDIDDLDSCWHEDIVDRGYTVEDAAYILENCNEEETDSGLWAGQDYRDEMSTRAAFSYSNDVWFRCEEMYKEIKDRMQELVDDENVNEDEAAKLAFDKFEDENKTQKFVPVEKDSEEELRLIREWIRRNEEDAGMRGGYPVGGSYIDSRCGTGYGMPDVKDYVDFDHEFAQRVPWLSGKYKEVVYQRRDELLDKKRKISDILYSHLDKSNFGPRSLTSEISRVIVSDCRLSLSDIREIIRDLEYVVK